MPSSNQHLEQVRAFQAVLEGQPSNAYAVKVLFLHLTGLHLIDIGLAKLNPPFHPKSHDERNTLLRRATTLHGIPRLAVLAYLELLEDSHETRYECPTGYRLERLHRDALENFQELKQELEGVGITL